MLGLALVLLSFPEHASPSGEFDNTSGRMSAGLLRIGPATGEPLEVTLKFSFLVVVAGTVYLGSGFMKEALQRAIELTDAAYARTSDR